MQRATPKSQVSQPEIHLHGYVTVIASGPIEIWDGDERLFVHKIDNEYNMYTKTPELVAQWGSVRLDPRVKRVVRLLAVELGNLDRPCVITSIFRDTGVHSDGRGVDVRLSVSAEQGEVIRTRINKWVPYGRLRYKTIPPLNHGTAPHFHMQVKPGA